MIKRNRCWTAALAALAIVVAAGCTRGSERADGKGGAPESPPKAGVATINDVVIGETRFAEALRDAAFAAKSATIEGRREVLDRLVDRELLQQEAAARGADRLPVVQRAVERRRRYDVLAQLTRQIAGNAGTVDSAVVDEAVGSLPQIMKATVMLVEDGGLAADLAQRIRQGEEIDALAAEHADGARKREFVTRLGSTMYPPDVETQLFAMAQGEVAALQTPVGYLVVRVDVKRSLGPDEVANARATVTRRIIEENLRTTQTGILDETRAKYPVKRLVARFADQPVPTKDRFASWRALQQTPLATVGPLTLMLDELYRNYGDYELVARSSDRSQNAAFEELAEKIISSALYYLAGRDQGLQPSQAIEQVIARELPDLMADVYTADLALTVDRERLGREECAGLFDKAPARYLPQGRVNLSQILVRREGQAQEVMARLRTGADFAAVARELSVDPSATQGGDLGWRAQRELVENFGTEGAKDLMQRAATDGTGLLTLRTTKGYHVLALGGYRRPGEGTYEEARELVLDDCLAEQRDLAVKNLVKKLRAKAVIVVDEAKLAAIEPASGLPADGVHKAGGSTVPGASPHGGSGAGSPHGGMGAGGSSGGNPHGGGGPGNPR